METKYEANGREIIRREGAKAFPSPVEGTREAELLFPVKVMPIAWRQNSWKLMVLAWGLMVSLSGCGPMFQVLRCEELCLLPRMYLQMMD